MNVICNHSISVYRERDGNADRYIDRESEIKREGDKERKEKYKDG